MGSNKVVELKKKKEEKCFYPKRTTTLSTFVQLKQT